MSVQYRRRVGGGGGGGARVDGGVVMFVRDEGW